MKRLVVLPMLLAVSACANPIDFRDMRSGRVAPKPVVAPAPTPAPVLLTAKERLVAAIESNGCELNASNVSVILDEATIGQEELKSLTPVLASEGRAEVAGSSIRVTTDRCI